jgi:hypothetical protein
MGRMLERAARAARELCALGERVYDNGIVYRLDPE